MHMGTETFGYCVFFFVELYAEALSGYSFLIANHEKIKSSPGKVLRFFRFPWCAKLECFNGEKIQLTAFEKQNFQHLVAKIWQVIGLIMDIGYFHGTISLSTNISFHDLPCFSAKKRGMDPEGEFDFTYIESERMCLYH